jgi:phage-related baseplate assembly protein
VTVHVPPAPEEIPVPVALAQATPTQREAIMSALKHILVVANQTVAGERLIAAVRARAAADPIRVTVICPQNDPSDSWVVAEAAVAAATRARLDATLDALRSAGIEANGDVVDRDPYTAVLDVVESSDPPAEIIISTLPRTRSGWMRRDLVERLRDRTNLPVEHVVVDEPSESTRA